MSEPLFDLDAEPDAFLRYLIANRKSVIERHHRALDQKEGGKAAVDELAAVLNRLAEEGDYA